MTETFAPLLLGNGLLRIAASAGGVLIGVYLAWLSGQGMHVGAGTAGTLGAVAFGAELLFSLPLGFLSDVVPRRWMLVAGAGLGAVAVQLFALTRHVPVFYLSRALEGVGVAAVTPSLLAMLADNTEHAPERRTRAMSFFEISLLAGLALGGLAATQLWSLLGRGAFSAVGAVYILAGILFGLYAAAGTSEWQRAVPASAAPRAAAIKGLRRLLRDPGVRRLAPVWLCVNAVIGLWLGPTLPFLLTQRSSASSHPRMHPVALQFVNTQYLDGIFAGDPTRIGWLLLGYALLFGAGVAAWSFVLPRMDVRRAMRICLLAMLAVCGGFLLVNHSAGWPPAWRWVAGTATALLILVESGFTPAALSWLAASLGSGGGKGAVMGLYSLLLSLGAVLGSVLAGLLGGVLGFDGLLLGTAAMAVLGVALLGRLWPNRRTA